MNLEPDRRRAVVTAHGCGWPPVTVEVELDNGQRETIWYKGQRVGDRVLLERRQSASGPYWADVKA